MGHYTSDLFKQGLEMHLLGVGSSGLAVGKCQKLNGVDFVSKKKSTKDHKKCVFSSKGLQF